jgi:LysR family transcriptional regulator, transcriptional activator of nhaA
MDWLNYHHLLYFWVVAREGGLVPAGKALRLSHPTLSTQIHTLEDRLGEKLFMKVGRRLVLTETGRTVFRYADEIFSLGRELVDTVQGRSTGQPLRLTVGITDVVPKLVVRRLLEPALAQPLPIRLICREDSYEKLLTALALHEIDIVIADAPVPPGHSVRAFSHVLGETGVSFFAVPALVRAHGKNFPRSMDGAPMLLPLENLTLRRSLNQWFERNHVKPKIVAEFEDSALLKDFGSSGLGIFAAPTVVQEEVSRQYGVKVLGHADQVHEQYYAISGSRRLENPAVLAITDSARHTLFKPQRRSPLSARSGQR